MHTAATRHRFLSIFRSLLARIRLPAADLRGRRPSGSEAGTGAGRVACAPDEAVPAAFDAGGTRDLLAGLASRDMLEARIGAGIERALRSRTMLAVAWVELTGGGRVPELPPDDFGAEVIGAAAARLQTLLRMENTLAQVGPQAFGAVCEGFTDVEEIGQWTAHLERGFAVALEVGEGQVRVRARIGIASFPQDADRLPRLLALASSRAGGTNDPTAAQQVRLIRTAS